MFKKEERTILLSWRNAENACGWIQGSSCIIRCQWNFHKVKKEEPRTSKVESSRGTPSVLHKPVRPHQIASSARSSSSNRKCVTTSNQKWIWKDNLPRSDKDPQKYHYKDRIKGQDISADWFCVDEPENQFCPGSISTRECHYHAAFLYLVVLMLNARIIRFEYRVPLLYLYTLLKIYYHDFLRH